MLINLLMKNVNLTKVKTSSIPKVNNEINILQKKGREKTFKFNIDKVTNSINADPNKSNDYYYNPLSKPKKITNLSNVLFFI